ncbi:MAG TPA: aminotransferase class I/II-fold pyridoxal phosphate-dependent enzyme [Thermomicrobiales bacterium]|jgi:histidinol-phosphate aminotransferase|nr:aminotransferase class I/II-fold pyridoxal phosphate-dependent enzyme [Thermomicrobiales bacterium]
MTTGPIRLDLTANALGPTFGVLEALAGADGLQFPAGELETTLRERLAGWLGVPVRSVVIAAGIDRLLMDLFGWLRDDGPMVLFPPTDPIPGRLATWMGLPTIDLFRSPRFDLAVDADILAELPQRWSALVQTPNDPSGTTLTAEEAVTLARRARVLILDERHAAYSPRTLLPLAREFDNVVVVRTFETWAGLAGMPLAYAIVPMRLVDAFQASRPVSAINRGAAIAGHATMDDLKAVLASVRDVRTERARLYRMLRKLNMVSVPYPTWSNFLLVRAERTTAPYIVDGLARRDIRVAPVADEALAERVFRVSAGRSEHTDALRSALIEIGLTIP